MGDLPALTPFLHHTQHACIYHLVDPIDRRCRLGVERDCIGRWNCGGRGHSGRRVCIRRRCCIGGRKHCIRGEKTLHLWPPHWLKKQSPPHWLKKQSPLHWQYEAVWLNWKKVPCWYELTSDHRNIQLAADESHVLHAWSCQETAHVHVCILEQHVLHHDKQIEEHYGVCGLQAPECHLQQWQNQYCAAYPSLLRNILGWIELVLKNVRDKRAMYSSHHWSRLWTQTFSSSSRSNMRQSVNTL